MISDKGFDDLRVGATLSHIAPVRLRVGDGRRTIFEVGPPSPSGRGPCVWLPPCVFRCLRRPRPAGSDRRAAVAVRGLPAGVDPNVELALAPGDEARPGGRLRLREEDDWRHLFATTLPPERIPIHPSDDVQLYFDGATGVSVLESRGSDDDGLVGLLGR